MEQKNSGFKEIALVFSIALLAALAFSYALFGIIGARVVLGILFVSSPFYFILSSFKLDEAEKFVFSILMGLTIFPSLAYALGLVISFRVGILAVFAALVMVGFVARMLFKKHKIHNQSD